MTRGKPGNFPTSTCVRTLYRREEFWARGYAVSSVGFELDKIRDYFRRQEHEEHEEGQGRL